MDSSGAVYHVDHALLIRGHAAGRYETTRITVTPLGKILAAGGELLDSVIPAVGYQNMPLLPDGDINRLVQLAWTVPQAAPLGDVVSFRGKLL